MCCHPGYYISFIENRESGFGTILKDPRISVMGKYHWLQWKLISCLGPNKRVSLSLEASKPGIYFSSLAMKVLGGISFQYETVLSTLEMVYCSHLQSFSWLDLLNNSLQLLHQHLLALQLTLS